MVAMEEGRVSIAGADGTWDDIGYATFEIKYEGPEFEVANRQLWAYMRATTEAFRDLAFSFEMTKRQLRRLWPVLVGRNLDGPQSMKPGMVTWSTRGKRKRRAS